MQSHRKLGIAVSSLVLCIGVGEPSGAWIIGASAIGALSVGCQAHRAAVRLSMERAAQTPRDASVYIDEQFVGFLGVVAARGVRLPEGEHRITVEKVGFFPWDQRVVSDRQPIHLKVELRRIPD